MEYEQETQLSEEISEEQGTEQETKELMGEEQQSSEQEIKVEKQEKPRTENAEDKSSFMHGLAVGLGIGCIATFVIIWIAVFFSPQLPRALTYESMLSVFIYPMLYLLTVGLVALTAGIVREFYVRK
jgi:fructose-specific phosphotransferase system IIC component